MTDRQTKVTLTAQVSGYIQGMNEASRSTRAAASESEKLAEQQAAVKQSAQDAAVALGAIGAIAAASVVLAVKKFAEFDKQMSTVHAATQEGADGMGALREAALEAGSSTQYSATQAAEAITELGKAGISTSDILSGGLSAALNLAASDNLDLGVAAGIAATTMQQFGLEGKDAGHVADLLAAGANKALGGVEDLANGLKFVGPVANSMGVSLEETTAALASFANQGILGEQAGTSLRGVLSSLTSPSAQAKAQLDELGVTLYDSQGKFLGLANMAGELDDAFSGMDDSQRDAALGVIFGNQQITAARLLYQQGAEGINDWVEAVDEQGYAAKIAAQQMDNLAGDVTKLGNTFDTALIQSGSAANDVLRGITQSATDLVNGFNDAGPVVQGGALVLGAVTAAAALTGGGLLLLIPKIHQTKLAMQAMNVTGGTIAKGFGKGGAVLLAITALSGAIAGISSSTELSADQLAKLDASLKVDNLAELNKQFTDANGNVVSFSDSLKLAFTGDFWTSYQGGPAQINGAIKAISFGAVDLGAAMDANKARFAHMGEALGSLASEDFPGATEQFKQFVDLTDGSDESIRQLLVAFPQYSAALRGLAADQGETLTEQELLNLAQGEGALATKLATDAANRSKVELGKMGAAAEDTSGAVSSLADALGAFNDVQFTADDAVSAFHQSMLDVTAAMKADGFTGTLNENTQEGIDNNRMLRDLAESTNTAAAKTLELTGNQDDANAILAEGRKKLEDIGTAFGLSGDGLQTFIDKYVASPKDIEYQASVHGIDAASKMLQAVVDTYDGKKIGMSLFVDSSGGSKRLATDAANLTAQALKYAKDQGLAKASGGRLPGAPSSKDNMLIAAASGEFVTNAAATSKNIGALHYINSGGVIPGYASGGQVGYAPAQYSGQYSGSGRGDINVDLNLSEVTNTQAVAEIVFQGLRTRLVGV